MAKLCKESELHATQVLERKRRLLEGAADVFGGAGHAAAPVDLAPLHAEARGTARRDLVIGLGANASLLISRSWRG
jgi:transposase